ncbi:unnamed protein product [Dibothriocephalus latus]|uniref:Inositol polyphosphate-related phosphatase domain-containing protein n=1 Tax=Dibothriocephalus latus TaxID=60516 RepID=A0A3P7L4H7_DIBLA|nr:unnamed protein product [Dibothriocephalus latus]
MLKAMKEDLIFQDFLEGPIRFPPTFKFDKGTNIYDTRTRLHLCGCRPGDCLSLGFPLPIKPYDIAFVIFGSRGLGLARYVGTLNTDHEG